jgi:hypothetical protein
MGCPPVTADQHQVYDPDDEIEGRVIEDIPEDYDDEDEPAIDADAVLEDIRTLVSRHVQRHGLSADETDELVRLISELDGALCDGQMLPDDWGGPMDYDYRPASGRRAEAGILSPLLNGGGVRVSPRDPDISSSAGSLI